MGKVKVFVNYYRPLLEKFLNPLSVLKLMPCLNDKVKLRIYEATDNPIQQVDLLLIELEKSNDEGVLGNFLDALKLTSDHRWLYPVFDETASEVEVKKIFDYKDEIDKIAKLFDLLSPEFLNINANLCIDVLAIWLSDQEKENLKQKCQNYGNQYTLWWLFRVLMRQEKGWIEDFYKFVQEQNYSSSASCGPLAQIILDFFDFESVCSEEAVFVRATKEHSVKCFESPSSDNVSDGYREAFQENGFVSNVENDYADDLKSPIQATDSGDGLVATVSSTPENLEVTAGNSSTNSCGTQIQPISLEDEETIPKISREVPILKLRNYQKELAKLAVEGKNVIICSPPGAGKTVVAAYIIKNYLETRGNSQKSVLFFTPGGALAQQQHQRLEAFLPKEFRVTLCYGNNGDNSRLELHQSSDVVVMTPQILVNSLLNKSEDNPIKSIDQFGLFIFDECHHCMKDNPSHRVMIQYIILKKHLSANQRLPQVVGMTATMGVGKKKSVEPVAAVLELCANMDAQSGIVTVQDPANLEELHEYIPQPKHETIGMLKRENDQFYDRLLELMDEIVNILHDFKGDSLKLDPLPPYHGHEDDIRNLISWLESARNLFAEKSDTYSRDLISCLDHLKICAEAKDIYLKCQPIDALDELKRFEDITLPEKRTEIEIKLYLAFEGVLSGLEKLAEDERCANPDLKKIKALILDKFRREPDSSGMFMVQKKKYARALKAWMHRDDDLKFLNAQVFMGISALSHTQQDKIMKAFRRKEYRMLVSTPDSAGEGIDVADCNIVINYDFHKSEVSTIQIKGRVRKTGGQVFEISSPKIEKHDELNFQKTLLMYKAIDRVQCMAENNTAEYLQEIAKLQDESRSAYQLAALLKLSLRPQYTNKEYFLLCFKCNVAVCSSLDVRVVESGQRVIPTSNFEHKYKLKEHPRKEKNMGPGWKKLSKVVCRECDHEWGIKAVWDNRINLPLIKITGFKLKDVVTGKIDIVPRWKNCPFAPIEASLSETLIAIAQESISEADN